MSITASRVVNVAAPITSRTGVARAEKARDTLQTAQAILRTSTAGPNLVADSMQSDIDQLNAQIRAYYIKRRGEA